MSQQTLKEQIVARLRAQPGGMTDAELAIATGKLHQQINQRCRQMETVGILTRDRSSGVIVNRLRSQNASGPVAQPRPVPHSERSWDWEGNVQAVLCRWLEEQGWQLLQVADTATKQQGTDVVTERAGQRLHVEVKGYPSKTYADPRRAGEVKPTQPTLQAGHWYADALVQALRLREKHSGDQVAMAFPDAPRYRSLLAETASTLRNMRIGVFLVAEDGLVELWEATNG
ncbi:hypothetical protein O3597_20160 [Verrucosispora sp. WMMA2044]|uniref:hypothetical protein n=1 Tax=Verrucosispora sp. WMMA2044 TaxID=3016419 RepID=UPI00248CE921|nr:hypothetical protein [Verrucosispora sp. WMMA2044]WBB47442.1 hypothetical protein O3597_20160 [Verrucosispora sp. WMMA2044]